MKTISILLSIAAFACVEPQVEAASNENGRRGAEISISATNSLVVTPELLSQLSEEIRTNNPSLGAATARSQAAEANVGTVRTWDDPMVSVGGMAAERMMRQEDGDLIYGVEQKLPLFGKPKSEHRLAAAEASTEAARAEYRFQRLRAEFASAAFRAALANEIVIIGEEDLSWLDLMRRTADSKYESGQATLVEVLQVQNEHARRATLLQTERDRLSHEIVTLNRFLDRDQQSAWPRLKLPEPGPAVAFNKRLVDFALKYEPRMLMLREEIKTAEAAVDVARRNRFPDVSVGLEGRNYTGDGSFRQGMLFFSTSLPWVNGRKYRNEEKRERAKLSAVEFELADYRAELSEEVHMLTVRIDAARREALLYRDEILPRTRAAMETIRANWEANRASVRELLEARRMLLDARLMYARAVAEQYEMLSDLVLCCGLGDLAALQMLAETSEESN